MEEKDGFASSAAAKKVKKREKGERTGIPPIKTELTLTGGELADGPGATWGTLHCTAVVPAS